jgi:hypothetical protein
MLESAVSEISGVSCMCHAVWLGVFSSFVASLVYLGFALFRAAHVRTRRAKPFIGNYAMLDPNTKEPRGGTVTVEPDPRYWDTDTTSVLTASAKHSTGEEDWVGTLEVRGLSDIASGFYLHPNSTGGFLQFTRVGDSEIMEQGHPHDPKHDKFQRLLRRLP